MQQLISSSKCTKPARENTTASVGKDFSEANLCHVEAAANMVSHNTG
jgi:hypothetical protein